MAGAYYNVQRAFAPDAVKQLNSLWESNILTDAAKGRIMQEYNSGMNSADIIKTLDKNVDYKKTIEAQTVSAEERKIAATEAERLRQQEQSKQLAPLFQGFVQPGQQPPLPGIVPPQVPAQPPQVPQPRLAPGQQPGVAPSMPGLMLRQPGADQPMFLSSLSLPSQQFQPGVPPPLSQMPQMGAPPQGVPPGGGQLTPLEAFAAMYRAGVGPTEPGDVAGIIGGLYPTPLPSKVQQGPTEFQLMQEERRRDEENRRQRALDIQERLGKGRLATQEERLDVERIKESRRKDLQNMYIAREERNRIQGEAEWLAALRKERRLLTETILKTAKNLGEVNEENVASAIEMLSSIDENFEPFLDSVVGGDPGFLQRIIGKTRYLKRPTPTSAIVPPRIDASKKDELDTILEIQ